MQIHDFFQCRVKFLSARFVDDIREILANHGHVGGNHHHVQIIYLFKLGRLGVRGTGHARKLVIHAEIILKSNRCQGLILVFDLDGFFGFQCLMQSLAVAASGHQPAGKFINDDDFAVFHDIVDIPLKQRVRLKGLVYMMEQLNIFRIVEVIDLEQFFGSGNAVFGKDCRTGLFIDGIVFVFAQPRNQSVDLIVQVG